MGAEGTSQEPSGQALTRYRSSFWTVFWYFLAWAAPAAFVAAAVVQRGLPNLFGFTISFGAGVGACVLLIVAGIAIWTTEAGVGGVRGFDFFSRRRFMAWDEIGAVRPINMGGIKYLRVFPADGTSPLWLPLFLERQREFEQQVIAAAPDRNPLRVFFAGPARRRAAAASA